MAENSAISWTDHTFNGHIGCQKVHAGCTNCYAESFAKRTAKAKWGADGTRVKTSDDNWRKPLKWNRDAEKAGERKRVFCSSLADVFEDWKGPVLDHHGLQLYTINGDEFFTEGEYPECRPVTLQDIRMKLFKLIDATPWLDWLLLTKRPENVMSMWPQCGFANAVVPGTLGRYRYFENIWLGTSMSDQPTANKWTLALLKNRALVPILFASCEPLLGPIAFDRIEIMHGDPSDTSWFMSLDNALTGWHAHKQGGWTDEKKLDWVIVGGESGGKHRPMDLAWACSLRDQCAAAGVPFFFKQSAGRFPGTGTELDGEKIQQFPVSPVSCEGTV